VNVSPGEMAVDVFHAGRVFLSAPFRKYGPGFPGRHRRESGGPGFVQDLDSRVRRNDKKKHPIPKLGTELPKESALAKRGAL
jgi:hypothetical protein